MTVKNQDGKEVFSRNEEYGVYDLHFEHNKEGWIGLNDWDITAMDHIDLGIEPGEIKSYTFVIPLKGDTKSVDIGDVRKGYRKVRTGSHVIFFKVTRNGVIDAVRILHQKMDFDRHL